MLPFTPRKSSPRLAPFSYEGCFAYFITINAWRNFPHFSNAVLVRDCRAELEHISEQHDFKVVAYCFMPSHLHLLVMAMTEESALIPFVQKFKQITSCRFKARRRRPLWQRSFYDHVVRKEEDLGGIAEYIWNNPVRAKIVTSQQAYPYSGPGELLDEQV